MKMFQLIYQLVDRVKAGNRQVLKDCLFKYPIVGYLFMKTKRCIWDYAF